MSPIQGKGAAPFLRVGGESFADAQISASLLRSLDKLGAWQAQHERTSDLGELGRAVEPDVPLDCAPLDYAWDKRDKRDRASMQ